MYAGGGDDHVAPRLGSWRIVEHEAVGVCVANAQPVGQIKGLQIKCIAQPADDFVKGRIIRPARHIAQVIATHDRGHPVLGGQMHVGGAVKMFEPVPEPSAALQLDLVIWRDAFGQNGCDIDTG